MTRIVAVDRDRPEAAVIAEAADLLRSGALVAFPTETVYGLGAHALDRGAVRRLFAAKGRPPTDPVIVHVATAAALDRIGRDVPAIARELAARFWPGPLTLIVPRSADVPDEVTAGLATVAVRVPAHPVARALLDAAGLPIVAPSANRFSHPSPTRAAHVVADLGDDVDLIIDGGESDIGIESTVLDLTTSPPVVRRPGAVTLEMLRPIVAGVRALHGVRDALDPQPSPGQLARHYAPAAPLTLYVGDTASVADRVARDARAATASGARAGILAPEEDLMALAPRLAALASQGRIRTARYGSRAEPREAAQQLFAALRDIDGAGVDVILAIAPDDAGIGAAIVDRLGRAAEGRIVRLGR